jgi:hypothetical protein
MAKLSADYPTVENIQFVVVIGVEKVSEELVGVWQETTEGIPMERQQIVEALRNLADGIEQQAFALNSLEQEVS